MNGKMVVSKPLYVTLAQRKEDRRARLQVCLILNAELFLTLSLLVELCITNAGLNLCSRLFKLMHAQAI